MLWEAEGNFVLMIIHFGFTNTMTTSDPLFIWNIDLAALRFL